MIRLGDVPILPSVVQTYPGSGPFPWSRPVSPYVPPNYEHGIWTVWDTMISINTSLLYGTPLISFRIILLVLHLVILRHRPGTAHVVSDYVVSFLLMIVDFSCYLWLVDWSSAVHRYVGVVGKYSTQDGLGGWLYRSVRVVTGWQVSFIGVPVRVHLGFQNLFGVVVHRVWEDKHGQCDRREKVEWRPVVDGLCPLSLSSTRTYPNKLYTRLWLSLEDDVT